VSRLLRLLIAEAVTKAIQELIETHRSSLTISCFLLHPSYFPVMPRTDINNLPDDARIWIFGISPPLDEAQNEAVLATVDPFLDQWPAHNVAITSARTIIDGSFLVVAVDKQS